VHRFPPILLAAINPDSQGIWNQTKVVAVIVAAIVVAVLIGCLTLALGARKAKTSDIADHALKYLIIFGMVALVAGGAFLVLGDKVAAAIQ